VINCRPGICRIRTRNPIISHDKHPRGSTCRQICGEKYNPRVSSQRLLSTRRSPPRVPRGLDYETPTILNVKASCDRIPVRLHPESIFASFVPRRILLKSGLVANISNLSFGASYGKRDTRQYILISGVIVLVLVIGFFGFFLYSGHGVTNAQTIGPIGTISTSGQVPSSSTIAIPSTTSQVTSTSSANTGQSTTQQTTSPPPSTTETGSQTSTTKTTSSSASTTVSESQTVSTSTATSTVRQSGNGAGESTTTESQTTPVSTSSTTILPPTSSSTTATSQTSTTSTGTVTTSTETTVTTSTTSTTLTTTHTTTSPIQGVPEFPVVGTTIVTALSLFGLAVMRLRMGRQR